MMLIFTLNPLVSSSLVLSTRTSKSCCAIFCESLISLVIPLLEVLRPSFSFFCSDARHGRLGSGRDQDEIELAFAGEP
jgi:hypothetical protein